MTLSVLQVHSTLLFLAATYPIVSLIFKAHSDTSNYTPAVDDESVSNIGKKKKSRLMTSLLILSVTIAIKMVGSSEFYLRFIEDWKVHFNTPHAQHQQPQAYDSSFLGANHYRALEVPRHSNTLDIRRAYKEASKKYHPDKNPDAVDRFQGIKTAYDVGPTRNPVTHICSNHDK